MQLQPARQTSHTGTLKSHAVTSCDNKAAVMFDMLYPTSIPNTPTYNSASGEAQARGHRPTRLLAGTAYPAQLQAHDPCELSGIGRPGGWHRQAKRHYVGRLWMPHSVLTLPSALVSPCTNRLKEDQVPNFRCSRSEDLCQRIPGHGHHAGKAALAASHATQVWDYQNGEHKWQLCSGREPKLPHPRPLRCAARSGATLQIRLGEALATRLQGKQEAAPGSGRSAPRRTRTTAPAAP
jgi:hypothetical protein